MKISFILLLSFFTIAGCKKEEMLPPFHAKGTIILVTGGCSGEVVLIEVDKPEGIGISATFIYNSGRNKVTYTNGIGIPYFSKIGIPDSVPQTIGTHLYFEYRELTEEERAHGKLFSGPPQICLWVDDASPNVKCLVITKIINFY